MVLATHYAMYIIMQPKILTFLKGDFAYSIFKFMKNNTLIIKALKSDFNANQMWLGK